jgi:hypothetical protein
MNKEAFVKYVMKNYDVRKLDNTKNYRDRYIYLKKKEVLPIEQLFLYWEWSTGGMIGGNCWNDNPPHAYTSDEVEDSVLDKVLEDLFPQITFLQYRNFISKYVTVGSRSENEYYGNGTDYAVRTVNLSDLYNFLLDKGVISE